MSQAASSAASSAQGGSIGNRVDSDGVPVWVVVVVVIVTGGLGLLWLRRKGKS